MPRIKAITTGSIPSFVDLILNINEADTSSTLAAQDTWLSQLKAKDTGKLVMYGDDTWLKLFPDTFDRHDGTSSFFVAVRPGSRLSHPVVPLTYMYPYRTLRKSTIMSQGISMMSFIKTIGTSWCFITLVSTTLAINQDLAAATCPPNSVKWMASSTNYLMR